MPGRAVPARAKAPLMRLHLRRSKDSPIQMPGSHKHDNEEQWQGMFVGKDFKELLLAAETVT